jgi:hypothetical protein
VLANLHLKNLEKAMDCPHAKSHFVCALLLIGASVGCAPLAASSASAASAGCDAGKWPLSPVQSRFGGTLPTLASGDALPALGAPVLLNLSAQADVAFLHPPARAAKANPAYAAIIKLGPEPAATYQITLSDGAWVDVVDNGELVKQSGYVRRRDCPGIDKSIRFKTDGGPLSIQISGAYAKSIKIEAARAE